MCCANRWFEGSQSLTLLHVCCILFNGRLLKSTWLILLHQYLWHLIVCHEHVYVRHASSSTLNPTWRVARTVRAGHVPIVHSVGLKRREAVARVALQFAVFVCFNWRNLLTVSIPVHLICGYNNTVTMQCWVLCKIISLRAGETG